MGCACSRLQSVAVCCSVLQCVAVCCKREYRRRILSPLLPQIHYFRGPPPEGIWRCTRVAVCCRVLQYDALCCSREYWDDLWRILSNSDGFSSYKAIYQSVDGAWISNRLLYERCVVVCCSVLQCVAVCCRVSLWATQSNYRPQQRPSVVPLATQHTATHCNTLQHTVTHYNTLQHTSKQVHFLWVKTDCSFGSKRIHSFALNLCIYHEHVMWWRETKPSHNFPHTTTHRRNTVQITANHCKSRQISANHCNSLQLTATHCKLLQLTATHCNSSLRAAFQFYQNLPQLLALSLNISQSL